jgi:hypothetical protein
MVRTTDSFFSTESLAPPEPQPTNTLLFMDVWKWWLRIMGVNDSGLICINLRNTWGKKPAKKGGKGQRCVRQHSFP